MRVLSILPVLVASAGLAEPLADAPPAPEMIEVEAFFESRAERCTALAAEQGYIPHPIGLFDGPGLGFQRSPDGAVAHRAMSLRDGDGKRRTLYCHHDFLRDLTLVTPEADPPLSIFTATPRPDDRLVPVLYSREALEDWALATCRGALADGGLREGSRWRAAADVDDPRAIAVTLEVREGLFGRADRLCRVDALTGVAELAPPPTAPSPPELSPAPSPEPAPSTAPSTAPAPPPG